MRKEETKPMIPDQNTFDTNSFFTGGAGLFLQYHDVVKPVYLYVMIRMILTGDSFGLPIGIIRKLSNLSLIEWYMKRRYVNPLRQLDFVHKLDPKELDDLMHSILLSDPSLYQLAPVMNIGRMLSVYKQQHMNFPIFVYTEQEEPAVSDDCKRAFQGIQIQYVYGDLRSCLAKCDQNFTYIFSDIDLAKNACEILTGTYSHVLISNDFRYNHNGNSNAMKYNLQQMQKTHPFLRIGTQKCVDLNQLAVSLKTIYTQ
jgi:hypothetical protein